MGKGYLHPSLRNSIYAAPTVCLALHKVSPGESWMSESPGLGAPGELRALSRKDLLPTTRGAPMTMWLWLPLAESGTEREEDKITV